MIELVKQCAQEVYRELGPGHSEATIEAAMVVELSLLDVVGPFTIMRQVPCSIDYKGFTVGVAFIDILVDGVIVELKVVAKLNQKDEQQVRKYLTATHLDQGLLINFGPELEIIEIRRDNE